MSNGVLACAAAALSFVIAAVLGKFLVPFLHKLKYGQTILEEGPKWHKAKQGTPTMGGIMFIAAMLITAIIGAVIYFFMGVGTSNVSQSDFTHDKIYFFAGIVMMLCYGAIGFIDDYVKVVKKRNLGLTAKQKLVLQFAVAIAYIAFLASQGYTTSTLIPFVGYVDLGIFYYIIAVVVIVGIVNAVNLTDGIDGLCGSVSFFAFLIFMLIAAILSYNGSAILAAALAGGCLGFLVWNFHPAKVFMGDTGSLFLGGAVCALAFSVEMPILLLPIGLVYLCEMFSVMLQVIYFKATHGKRLFKMSPIHHHFEMCGWSENKIVLVFSLITVIFGALSVLAVYFGVFAA